MGIFKPRDEAHAHCDLFCGVYDPAQARIEAQSVLKAAQKYHDSDDAVYPGQIEVCDGIDNDCDPTTDETVDGDGDGFTICDGDCQDADASVLPSANNVPPFADNGPDQVLSLTAGCYLDSYGNPACFPCDPQTLNLSAAGSYDSDGDPLGFEWSAATSGGTGTVIVTPSVMTTDLVITAPIPASVGATATGYVLVQTEVYDCGSSSTATLQITVHCTAL